MPFDLTPSTAELLERAEAACAESRRLVQELRANVASARLALHRLEAKIAAIDRKAAHAWSR